MHITRVDAWPERLNDVVMLHQANAFHWGRFDCATLFNDAVFAVTGVAPLDPYQPWGSQGEAMRALVKAGVRSVLEFCELHFDEVVPADARRGDVGFTAKTDALMCPAIICGAEAVSRDEAGWLRFPTTLLVRAFRVGT